MSTNKFLSALPCQTPEPEDYVRIPIIKKLLLTATFLIFSLILNMPAQAKGQRPERAKEMIRIPAPVSTSSPGSTAEWGFFEIPTQGEPLSGLSDVTWSRKTALHWTKLEKKPGSGKYNWELLDGLVKEAQKKGLNLVFVIKTGYHKKVSESSCYRAASKSGENYHSCPIKAKYAKAYKMLIASILERYDGDGKRDMPGIKKSFQLDLQIENEAGDPGYWYYNEKNDGKKAAREYLKLLKLAYEAKQEADPGAKIILPGMIRPNRIARCAKNPSNKECNTAFQRRVTNFIVETLKHPEYFDAFDIHIFNYFRFDPSFIKDSLQWLKAEMKKNGYSKPIYSLEWTGAMMQMVVKEGHSKAFLSSYPHSKIKGKRFDESVYQNLHLKENKGHRSWIESEQAREFVKIFTTMLVNGVERSIHVKFFDYPGFGWNALWWNWQGIVRYEGTKKNPILIKKPAYYTYQILTEKIHGFTSYTVLSEKDIYAYRFDFKERKPVIIAWTEGKRRNFDLSKEIKKLKGRDMNISYFVESLDKRNKPVRRSSEKISSYNIPLSGSPIIIEAAGGRKKK